MPPSAAQQNEQLSKRLAAALEELGKALEEINRLSARVQELEAQHQEFLGRFRHDCLNQLGPISGFLTLLQDSQCGELNARQQRFVETIEKSANSLLALIEQTSKSNAVPSNETLLAPEA